MPKYIDRDSAIGIIEEKQNALCPAGLYGRSYVYGSDREKYNAWDEIIESLEAVPVADVAPVVHGRWFMRGGRFRCSVCDAKSKWNYEGGTGGWSHEYEQAKTPYCPNCGAKMDEEEN